MIESVSLAKVLQVQAAKLTVRVSEESQISQAGATVVSFVIAVTFWLKGRLRQQPLGQESEQH